MKYLTSILLIIVFITGCNDSSDTQEQSIKNAPQPNIQDSSLQPPKPPSL